MLTVRDLNPADFESPLAYAHFVEAVSAYLPEEQARMCSVVGKPSQFVGRVTTLQTAIEHWRQWDQWEQQEQARQASANKHAAGEVPPPPGASDSPDLAAANRAWREAVASARRNKSEWDDYARKETERIRDAARVAQEIRDAFVREKRDAFRALKSRNG